MNVLLGPVCRCSHGIAAHDLGTHKADLGQRTACSVSTGPKGTPCDCKTYRPETTTGNAA